MKRKRDVPKSSWYYEIPDVPKNFCDRVIQEEKEKKTKVK